MRTSSRIALMAAFALLVGAPVADAAKAPRAKVRTLTVQVAAAPYVVGKQVFIPVLVDRRATKRSRLSSPVGLFTMRMSKRVKVRGQRARIAPDMLRAGDRVRARAKVNRAARQTAYWRMKARKLRVTKRSSTLGPAELRALIDGLGKNLGSLQTAVTNLAKYVQAGFQKQGTDIASLKTGLASLTDSLAALEKRVAAMEAGLPGLEARLQEQIDALATDLSALKTQVNTLQTQIGTLQTQLATLQTQVGALQTQLTTLEGQFATLSGDVTTLKNQMTAVQNSLTTVQGQVGTLQGQVGTLQGQVGGLQTSMDALCNPPSVVAAVC